MTNEEIRENIKILPVNSIGKKIWNKELKQAVLDSLKDFNVIREATDYYGIAYTLVTRWRGGIKSKYIEHGNKGIRYTIPTKIEAAKQVLEEGKTIYEVSVALGTSHQTIAKWVDDYRNDLYTLDHVVQITRKKIRSVDVIIGEVKKMEKEIEKLKQEAKQAIELEYQNKLKEIS